MISLVPRNVTELSAALMFFLRRRRHRAPWLASLLIDTFDHPHCSTISIGHVALIVLVLALVDVRDTREDHRTPYKPCAAHVVYDRRLRRRARPLATAQMSFLHAGIQGRFTLDRDNSALAGKHGTSPHIRLHPYINGIKHLGNLIGSQFPVDLYARYLRGRGHEVSLRDRRTRRQQNWPRPRPVNRRCIAPRCDSPVRFGGAVRSFDHYGRSITAKPR
jgi:hypothetical protein